jgi:hypothetical protein
MPVDYPPPMPRKVINVRASTFDDLDEFRTEVEPGKRESWDEFFRRIMREGHLKRP